ncbi:MAG: biotin--[acetyl-CoA-carboxylase] ligase [Bacteroidetes bacterium]|mgnify:CR=1 FL=1|nr:biotin--[acetyl-CoA-carboxylase] ligase [Bacteroidota bacterium]
MHKTKQTLPHSTPINPLGYPFIELTDVDSSNNYAMQQLKSGHAGHGAAFFADHQSGGRGRRGKIWESPRGENIILSVIIDTTAFQEKSYFTFSMAMAIGVHHFFSFYAQKNISIKWPNDIYYNDRKAAGILVENIFRGLHWNYAIVGIGMNINQVQFDPAIPNPVSLKQITQNTYQPALLARDLCMYLNDAYELLSVNEKAVIEAYNKVLYLKNERATFKLNSEQITCTIQEVDKFGKLYIQHPVYDFLEFDTVQWVLPKK